MNDSIQKHIGKALDLVEALRAILPSSSPIDLPSVVVVGSQSAGKSSLIERLSGVQLPQAEKLCTRAALVLQMRRSKETDASPRYWIWSEGGKGKVKKEIEESEIADMVVDLTEDLTGNSVDITDKKIYLRVERPDLYDYTLIDMPGLVYSPSEGQREDISQHVRETVLRVIRPENTLILCVFMGGINPEAQESRQLAAIHDPEGKRTLGVLTKLDLQLDQTSPQELRDVMMQVRAHEKVKLKLGMFAIRNRTHQETKMKLPLERLDQIEQGLIKKHGLSDLESFIGRQHLSKKVAQILAKQVHAWIPGVLRAVNEEKAKLQESLNNSTLCHGELDSYRYLVRLAEPLETHLSELEQGTLHPALMEKSPVNYLKKIFGLNEVQKVLQKMISLRSLSSSASEIIKQKLNHYQGSALPDFINDRVFESVALPIVAECCNVIREAFRECCIPFREFFLARAQEAVENSMERVQEFFVEVCTTHCDYQISQAIGAVHEAMLLEESKVLTLNSCYTDNKNSLLSLLLATDKFGELRDTTCLSPKDLTILIFQARIGRKDNETQRNLAFQLSLFSYLAVVRKRLLDDAWKLFWNKLLIRADKRLHEYLDSLSRAHVAAALSSTPFEQEERERLEANWERYDEAERMVEKFFESSYLPAPMLRKGWGVEMKREERSWGLELDEEDDNTDEQIFVEVGIPKSLNDKIYSKPFASSVYLERHSWRVVNSWESAGFVLGIVFGENDDMRDIKCSLAGIPPKEWEFRFDDVVTFSVSAKIFAKTLITIEEEEIQRYQPGPLLLSLGFLK